MVHKTLIASSLVGTILLCTTILYLKGGQKRLLRDSVDIVNIHDMNYYSKASYCSVEKLSNWDCGEECVYHPKMQDVQAFNDQKKESQGYCGYNSEKNQIVVAFRGTYFLKNWLTDFKAIPVNYSECEDCKIHMGFRDHLQPILDEIIACTQKQLENHPKAQVIVTGHSLGGAMATLAVIPISKLVNNEQQIYLYTFGAPRVGNSKFATYLNKLIPNSFRVVNYHDIVPHVPFQKLFNFQHHGYEVWMTKEDSAEEYKVCYNEEGESKECASSLLPIFLSVKNHIHYFGIYTGCNADLPQKDMYDQQNQEILDYYHSFNHEESEKAEY